MPVEMGIWRMDGDTPRQLPATAMPTEVMLEEFLERDPSLLGDRLLVIGRQVRTPYGKLIDLLAMDIEGNLHVLELKRDKTPRDVVAQVLDYGSWVTTLDRESVIDLANEHLRHTPFETAFEEVFGISAPDELNASLNLVVVATDLDSSSERIVTYLRDFGVPVNVVFFTYLEDDDRRYLARSWLAADDEGVTGTGVAARKQKGKRAEWNGTDWFVSFGDEGSRSWDDGRRYGFISAGGGRWYSGSLHNLPVGARVNVHIPKSGYVAIGEVLRPATRFDEAEVLVDDNWVRLADQQLHAPTASARTAAGTATMTPNTPSPSAGTSPFPSPRRSGSRACSPTRTAPASCDKSSRSTNLPNTSDMRKSRISQ
ncbi:hypothetical protein ACFSSF_17160 [Dietzia aerolata]|uniref:hypothetical protein n=1 Tax=Dietzia aerolata TaxID=595984 RepID=UPI00362FDABF